MRKIFTPMVILLACHSVFAQNTGIGTTEPKEKLHVLGNIKIGEYTKGSVGRLILDATAANEGGQLTIKKSPTASTIDWTIDQATDPDLTNARFRIFGGTDDKIGISIMENGNVGIGSNNPLFRHDVNGNAAANGFIARNIGANIFSHANFSGYSAAGGTLSSPMFVQNGNVLAAFSGRDWKSFLGALSVASSGVGGSSMMMYATEDYSTTQKGSNIVFSTTTNGQVNASEKLRIEHDGSVRISSLAGSGIRNVAADANGNLLISAAAGASSVPLRTVTDTDTSLAATDNGGYLYIYSSSPRTVTVPSLGVGFSCVVVQKGAGQITFVGSGVTLETARGTHSRAQFSAVGIIQDTSGSVTLTGDAN